MKVFVALLFFAAISITIVESQAHGRSISHQNGNNRVGRNSARSGGNIGARGNSAKPKNPPRHVEVRRQIHNKPIPNKPVYNKPPPNKPISNKPSPNKPIPNKPSSNKPPLNKPPPNKPVPHKPPHNKPAPNKHPSNKPSSAKVISNNPASNKLTPTKLVPNTSIDNKPTPNKPTPSNLTLNKPDLKNMKIDSNVNAQAKTMQKQLASTIQAGKIVDKKINSPSTNVPTISQKDNKPGTSNNIKETNNGDSIKTTLTIANGIPGVDVKAKKEIINKNGNAVSLTMNASQQKGGKPDLSLGIEGTKEIINKNGMSLSANAAATQHIGSKPEVSLGIKGTKNGNSVDAAVKMTEGMPGWDVKGTKEFINKNGNEVTLTAGASQQKGSKPDVFLGIQNTKDGNSIGTQVNINNGKPGLSIEGKNEFYNKNGISMAANAGASLQKGSKPEEFVGITATKGGDSLNARLNMVDNKVGWDLKGTKNIYDKNGVDVSLNAGVQQQPGGKPAGIAELEIKF